MWTPQTCNSGSNPLVMSNSGSSPLVMSNSGSSPLVMSNSGPSPLVMSNSGSSPLGDNSHGRNRARNLFLHLKRLTASCAGSGLIPSGATRPLALNNCRYQRTERSNETACNELPSGAKRPLAMTRTAQRLTAFRAEMRPLAPHKSIAINSQRGDETACAAQRPATHRA